MKGLLVENEDVFCPIVQEIFREDGITIDCVATFDEGLSTAERAKLQDDPYDFAVTDLDTGKGLWDTLDRLFLILAFVPKVIVISGYASQEIRMRAKDMGAIAFIGKGEPLRFRDTVLAALEIDASPSLMAAASEQVRQASELFREACADELEHRRREQARTDSEGR